MKLRSPTIAMRLVRLLAIAILGLCWFVTNVPSATADTLTYQPGPYQGKDAWITSHYDYGSNYGVNDNRLVVGGWGDIYMSALWFDLNGLPNNPTKVELKLYCLPKGTGDTSTPVSMEMYLLGGTWDEESISWYDDTTYYPSTKVSLPIPTQNAWYTIDLTTYYRNWKSGTWPKDGIWLSPTANNNRFNQFASSDYANATYRPKLVITHTVSQTIPFPTSMKMPLPGGKSWFLSTEIGGANYFDNEINPGHTLKDYYSLDLAPVASDGSAPNEVAILAAADGYVIEVGSYNPSIDTPTSKPNGNYVVINHSYTPASGTLFNRSKGLNSFYLHMKYPPAANLIKGARVLQGTKLGIVGKTGNADGPHLHFELKFEGVGITRNELTAIKMEGICLKQYQAKNGTNTNYYPSTNIQR